MTSRGWTESIAIALLVLVLFLASFNLVASSDLFFSTSFSHNSVQQDLPGTDIHATHEDVMRFLRSQTGTLPSLFSEREKAHFEDVRTIWRIETAILFLAAVLAITFHALSKKRTLLFLRRAGRNTVLTGVVLILLTTIFFAPLFSLFHELFFPEGTYTFNPATEPIVVLYPTDLFLQLAASSVMLAMVLGMIMWALPRMTQSIKTTKS